MEAGRWLTAPIYLCKYIEGFAGVIVKHLFKLALAASMLFVAASPISRAADTFVIFAAASLHGALDEVVKGHAARTGDTVRVSYGPSSALARQIVAGAPADIFVSADIDWMDYLDQRGLIKSASRQILLRNRLALIAPAASTASLKIGPGFPLEAALGSGRLAMADPDSVPAGKYGRAALQALGVWKDVQSRLVPAEDVRAALVFVARREVPFGIVYSTDATVERRVRVVDLFPENTHPPIIYPAASVTTSKSSAAVSFLKSLSAPAARAVFDKYGFK